MGSALSQLVLGWSRPFSWWTHLHCCAVVLLKCLLTSIFPLLLFCLYDEPFFSQETLIFGTTNLIQSSIIWLCPQKTCAEVSQMRPDVCRGPHINAMHLHSALLVSHRELKLPSHAACSLYFPQNVTRDCPTPWCVCFPDACCATFEIK